MKGHIKNEGIWRETNIEPTTTFLRKRRLRWYDHLLRKEGEDTTRKMLNMQAQGKSKKRWLDNIRDDMEDNNRLQYDRRCGARIDVCGT